MDWIEFAAAFAVFFVTHAVPVRPPVRAALIVRLGRRGFTLVYSALSLAALAWVIGAAGRAPFVPLWPRAAWQSLVPIAAMLPACLILACALGRPNPFSFGGSAAQSFDLARPGVVRLSRHPFLLVLAIWALAHLVPNGDLAHVLLFGSFGVFALLGQRMIDRRKRRDLGDDWQRLEAARQAAPLRPGASAATGAAGRLALAVALYLGLILLHPLLFGVSPWP